MSAQLDVNAKLEEIGQHVAAHIEKARKYEGAARDKVSVELTKADNHWTSVAKYIAEAHEICKKAGLSFPEFKEKWAPDVARAMLFRLVAIGSGKVEVEEQRKTWRDAKREERAASKKAKAKSRTDGLSETRPFSEYLERLEEEASESVETPDPEDETEESTPPSEPKHDPSPSLT